MKIRTPRNQCIICGDKGVVIIRAEGVSTYRAIKRMRQYIDAKIAEEKAALEQTHTNKE